MIVISDEIRATLVDHVVNHGLTMREAGQRVQPHLSRYSVASIIRTFRKERRIGKKSTLTRKLQYCISIQYSMSTVVQYCLWTVL